MPIKATELKRNQAIMWDGQLHVVLDTEHVKPGKGPAYVQAKMRNLDTGTIKKNRINSSDKLEDVTIDRRTMQYLFDRSGQGTGPYVFMDKETFEQIDISQSVLPSDQSQWLRGNEDCSISLFEGNPISLELPVTVELKIADTAPQAKGSTATNQLKEATTETGASVRVPPFIKVGQAIRINPATGEYLGKA